MPAFSQWGYFDQSRAVMGSSLADVQPGSSLSQEASMAPQGEDPADHLWRRCTPLLAAEKANTRLLRSLTGLPRQDLLEAFDQGQGLPLAAFAEHDSTPIRVRDYLATVKKA